MFSVDSFRENGKCLWSVVQICCLRGGKGARFTISTFSRYKDSKISDLIRDTRDFHQLYTIILVFSVDSFRENGKCLWSVEQICCFRGGKGARFIISAFSRYKNYKISDSDLTQSNRYSSVPNPNQYRAVLFSLGPRSAMGEKGEKRGQIGKTWASRAVSSGGFSHSQTTSRLALLAIFFFFGQRRFFLLFLIMRSLVPG